MNQPAAHNHSKLRPLANLRDPTRDFINKATVLFDRVEAAAAGDKKLLNRVQAARLPIMYVKITLAGEREF